MGSMEKETKEEILRGYQRIAFGSVSDPVRLLFCEDIEPRGLKDMDLFSISEIKRVKGGMEIKFFDRIRALQCMQELNVEEKEPFGFYEALQKGSEALRGEES